MDFKRMTLVGLTVAGMTAGAVWAAGNDGPPPAVKARQAHMQLYAFNLGMLGAMAKGAAEFDAEKAQRAANNLAALVSIDQTDYWVPGTSSAEIMETRLKPELFDNIPDVITKVKALEDAVMALQGAAGTLDGLRGAIGPVGGACGACHKAYREPKQ